MPENIFLSKPILILIHKGENMARLVTVVNNIIANLISVPKKYYFKVLFLIFLKSLQNKERKKS